MIQRIRLVAAGFSVCVGLVVVFSGTASAAVVGVSGGADVGIDGVRITGHDGRSRPDSTIFTVRYQTGRDQAGTYRMCPSEWSLPAPVGSAAVSDQNW